MQTVFQHPIAFRIQTRRQELGAVAAVIKTYNLGWIGLS